MPDKIGFAGDVFSVYENTGIRHYAKEVLNGLIQNNANILLFLSSHKALTEFKEVNTSLADWCHVGEIDNLDFIPNLQFFMRNVKLSINVNKLVDVFYSPQCRITDLSYILNLKVPTLTTLHDIHGFMTAVPVWYKARSILRHMAPQLLVKKENVFLAVPTYFIKKHVVELLHISSKKIKVVPAAVNPPSWILDMKKDNAQQIVNHTAHIQDYIIFLGRQQQVPMFLSLLSKLKTYNVPVCAAIAGIASDSQFTEELIRAYGLEKNVKTFGVVSEKFKWILLKGATMFVFPEYGSGGFGIPPLEAMSIGTPVVASNTGPLPEVIDDGGLLGTNKELVDLAYQLYTDEHLRKKMSLNGIDRAKVFHPQSVASNLLECLDKITSM